MSQFEQGVVLGASILSLVWLATRILDYWLKARSRRAANKNFIRLLFAEIDFNAKDLLFFIESSRNLDALKQALLNDDNLVPHITDAHHDIIFKQNIDKLPAITDDLIAKIVLFYGLLDKISGQVAGLNMPSFKTVSPDGQFKAIQHIFVNAREAEDVGKQILKEFSQRYKSLQLHRQFRSHRSSVRY
ncbi:hypothetical protein BFP76_07305 [Amylibacter kogurei]|uniref:Uncharacterized protein n=1 Tax=Paramylibacter kogurei TaxID=1889778 RepID=A0A2G5K7G2_9RHOB|nr:hypothetical protein [Amylibacter kogurei]PIB24952.1 hypothetical protein BFP76_07305 [Amylibacter kogurei]